MTSIASARTSAATTARSGGRGRLGAGLVEIPPVPFIDPADAVLVDPTVAESRRFCTHCHEPVGRGRDGVPGRAAGFCRTCGAPFSFEPQLRPGDLVGGQYAIAGCLAHGGMGWIYLGRDRNVSERWVVLKGLLNADDGDATAAALAERRFLAEVEHPNIVKIFNFVQHANSGYIVMEYVGGQNLKQILTARRESSGGEADPLPPAQAIAYLLEILPALGYLHDTRVLFCDFKPDNVIQTQHSLKLIDLGGVYHVDDPSAAVFGTPGYEAPEIPVTGPSVASDLFTVARTLAVLCTDFPGQQSTYRFTLPPHESVALFQRHDSLYRFLLKGTAANPDDRFQSAEEMAEQLHGVLREVVADLDGTTVPFASALFTSARHSAVERPDWSVLPRPRVSSDDPGAGYLATIAASDPQQLLAQLHAAPERTREVDLRLAATLIEAGDSEAAERLLGAIGARDPQDWRVNWYLGIAELSLDLPRGACPRFTAVYRAVPGEPAPKLALALSLESAGDFGDAAPWYEIVSRTDPSTTSASFGLARCRLHVGDQAGALAAYARVPESSSGYIDAQTAQIRCLVSRSGTDPTFDGLLAAASILKSLPLEGAARDRLTAELLETALALARRGQAQDDGRTEVAGHRLSERELRLGLERSYRALARHASSRRERIRLVDQANRIRPRTLR